MSDDARFLNYMRTELQKAKTEMEQFTIELEAARTYQAATRDCVEKERMEDRIGILMVHYNWAKEARDWYTDEIAKMES